MPVITVTAVPAFSDNYIWLITAGGNSCAVVDPGDAQPVLEVLREKGLDLDYILITHHHPDHIGGMRRLQELTGAEVFGPHDPRIAGQRRMVAEDETVSLPALKLEFRVLEIPGHTSSHIAFFGHGCLFCGDTLFSVGCGRLFEGSPDTVPMNIRFPTAASLSRWSRKMNNSSAAAGKSRNAELPVRLRSPANWARN